jgi:hypothetical protein
MKAGFPAVAGTDTEISVKNEYDVTILIIAVHLPAESHPHLHVRSCVLAMCAFIRMPDPRLHVAADGRVACVIRSLFEQPRQSQIWMQKPDLMRAIPPLLARLGFI